MGNPYPDLPNVSSVHLNVTRILGQNPGIMTLQGTNSYLVGNDSGPRILIDTTGGDVETINRYVNVLKSLLEPTNEPDRKCEPPISSILLTHWHPDHTEGIEAVQNLVQELMPSHPNFNLETYKSPEGPNLKSIGYYNGPLKVLTENMIFSPPGTPSISLKPIFTPGHSVDHMCFAMCVNGTVECVFVGDLLLVSGNEFTGVANSGFVDITKTGVLRIRDNPCARPPILHALTGGATRICPHGDVITDPLAKIEEYKGYRMKHIHKTREGILQNPADTWLSEEKLIEQIYPTAGDKMKLMVGNNLRQCLFWHQSNNNGFSIADPVAVKTKERRTEADFKAATAIARPGYLPDILKEEWMWKWKMASDKKVRTHQRNNPS
ncbi:hypothetical protein Aperf_G00000045423 [Anoplocephala perfoliata]